MRRTGRFQETGSGVPQFHYGFRTIWRKWLPLVVWRNYTICQVSYTLKIIIKNYMKKMLIYTKKLNVVKLRTAYKICTVQDCLKGFNYLNNWKFSEHSRISLIIICFIFWFISISSSRFISNLLYPPKIHFILLFCHSSPLSYFTHLYYSFFFSFLSALIL